MLPNILQCTGQHPNKELFCLTSNVGSAKTEKPNFGSLGTVHTCLCVCMCVRMRMLMLKQSAHGFPPAPCCRQSHADCPSPWVQIRCQTSYFYDFHPHF